LFSLWCVVNMHTRVYHHQWWSIFRWHAICLSSSSIQVKQIESERVFGGKQWDRENDRCDDCSYLYLSVESHDRLLPMLVAFFFKHIRTMTWFFNSITMIDWIYVNELKIVRVSFPFMIKHFDIRKKERKKERNFFISIHTQHVVNIIVF
jgi:hypothetical protein